jgi:hypothetical protein
MNLWTQLTCQTGFPAFSSDSSGFQFRLAFSGGVYCPMRAKAFMGKFDQIRLAQRQDFYGPNANHGRFWRVVPLWSKAGFYPMAKPLSSAQSERRHALPVAVKPISQTRCQPDANSEQTKAIEYDEPN